MAKLPKEIVLEGLRDVTYTYLDFVEMLADMKRFRRWSGWHLSFVSPKESKGKTLLFLFSEDSYAATFSISVATVARTLWPSRYPNDPSVGDLRRTLFSRSGVDKIVASVNAVSKEEVFGPSILDLLLGEVP